VLHVDDGAGVLAKRTQQARGSSGGCVSANHLHRSTGKVVVLNVDYQEGGGHGHL
jgi:hypothetical protein